ncbi:MAG: hypothetical protein R3E10_11300 [Gemmatimonadota bacterium]
MKARMGVLIAVVASAGWAATPLLAQRGPQRPGRDGPRVGVVGPRGGGVEGVLRQRERLELTEDQVARLNQIRVQHLEQSEAGAAELRRLRSDMAAGEITGADAQAKLHEAFDRMHERQDQVRTQINGILSEEQQTKLREGRLEARRGARGQRGAQGPGLRGRRPGPQGQGFRGRSGPDGPSFRGPGGPEGAPIGPRAPGRFRPAPDTAGPPANPGG